MTDRIEKDDTGAITSWVRYEYEGLNLIRMDQMYDNPPPTTLSSGFSRVSKGGRGTPWPSIRSIRSATRPTQAHGVSGSDLNAGDPFRPLAAEPKVPRGSETRASAANGTHGSGSISPLF